MKKVLLIIPVLLYSVISAFAQKAATENIIIVTLDGLRWQEVFKGIDPALVANKKYCRDSAGITARFGADDEKSKRQKLFPFIWGEIDAKGRIYGNRNLGNKVNVANRYQFSYPGYNEIFTGYPDTAVNSNDKILNPNTNVLEFLNKQKGFAGKVAAFSTWDVFPYILNEKRSGVYVNADVDTLSFKTTAISLINDMQFLAPQPIGVRPDVITYFAAREYLKEYRPRVLYIAFDETDDYAHGGYYDQYIGSAHAEDAMIADLWKTVQSIPQYKDKTTLIITCDHGRGDINKDQWRDHGSKVAESGEIWIAMLGAGIKTAGEMSTADQLYQQQIAATIAKLLGYDFRAEHPVAPFIDNLFK